MGLLTVLGWALLCLTLWSIRKLNQRIMNLQSEAGDLHDMLEAQIGIQEDITDDWIDITLLYVDLMDAMYGEDQPDDRIVPWDDRPYDDYEGNYLDDDDEYTGF